MSEAVTVWGVYVAGILTNLQCVPIRINGASDHVHILFLLSKNHSLAKTIEEVKKSSSRWVKSEGSGPADFFQVYDSTLTALHRKIDRIGRHRWIFLIKGQGCRY